MKRYLKNILLPIILASILFFVIKTIYLDKKPIIEDKFWIEERVITNINEPINNENQQYDEFVFEIPEKYEISKKLHVFQTFNNCGPATLSMALSYYGVDVSQDELGNKMRPYQHPKGDNDDKTIFTHEFVDWAQYYGNNSGLKGINLPNGDIELIKMFVSNDIPVILKTWLNSKEDVGHFILVRGYDDTKQIIIYDDSYYGPDRKVKYFDMLSLWQPFNYNYIVLFEESQQDLVKNILGEEIDEKNAWKNAVTRATKENEIDSDNIYPLYNLSVGHYHLGDYQKSIQFFERVENRLPKRMLWYQIEPIKSYVEVKDYNRVFEIIENILENGNRAFSELYLIRGDIYLEQNSIELAKSDFEKAVFYNINLEPAREALNSLATD